MSSFAEKFAKAVAKAQIVIELLPTITGLVTAAERMFPVGGSGAAKLEAVRKMLETAYAEAKDIGVSFEEIWPMLANAIAAIVAAANSLGLFHKAPTPPAAPSP